MKRYQQTLPSILEMTHDIVRKALHAGELAIDATAGNGHDTCFLAQLVGSRGHVYAFDIQETALLNTKSRLSEENLLERVTLFHENHAHMDQHIPTSTHDHIRAILFNLGYLPHGDKGLTTQAGSTVAALESGARLLAPGGIMAIVLYVGHPGGKEEAEAVIQWSEGLDSKQFHAIRYNLLNLQNHPPFLIAIEKKG
jgi:ubiquinone/menaquinone biosynthesis C-methylase UbiE